MHRLSCPHAVGGPAQRLGLDNPQRHALTRTREAHREERVAGRQGAPGRETPGRVTSSPAAFPGLTHASPAPQAAAWHWTGDPRGIGTSFPAGPRSASQWVPSMGNCGSVRSMGQRPESMLSSGHTLPCPRGSPNTEHPKDPVSQQGKGILRGQKRLGGAAPSLRKSGP